jgi:aldehyde dehydrogenase (NAD+)
VVIKPAELTSLSALYLAKLVVEAGFPPGTVNVVTGFGNEAGQALTEHPDVKKISFTGSTPVGKAILKTSADTNLKKVTLELGGKSPSIVFDDADLDQVIEAVNGGIFYNMGYVQHHVHQNYKLTSLFRRQNCCASSRVYVQESIYEDFLKRFAARARQNKAGDPFHKDIFLGPQIDEKQHSKIMGMIQRAKADGVRVVTGGTSPEGWFIEPTIFRDVKSSAEIMQEEVFGPVVAVASFKDIDDVLEKAHGTIYGLAAAVFTSDIKRGIRLSKMLQAGSVWVNNYNMISHALPFGGYGQSGNGKDLGSEGIEGYTQLKTVRFSL